MLNPNGGKEVMTRVKYDDAGRGLDAQASTWTHAHCVVRFFAFLDPYQIEFGSLARAHYGMFCSLSYVIDDRGPVMKLLDDLITSLQRQGQ